MNKNKLANTLATFSFIAMALTSASNASAVAISGNFGAGGYDTIAFSITSSQTVDFKYTGGYIDPTFSLFDGSGAYLITNDDADSSLYSHLTQNLAAGNYSLVVSYCCGFQHVLGFTSTSNTDGFNIGTYYFGSGMLSNLQSYLDSNPYSSAAGQAYALTISNNVNIRVVPEPATLALMGLGLLGVVASRRKKQNLDA